MIRYMLDTNACIGVINNCPAPCAEHGKHPLCLPCCLSFSA